MDLAVAAKSKHNAMQKKTQAAKVVHFKVGHQCTAFETFHLAFGIAPFVSTPFQRDIHHNQGLAHKQK